MCGEQAAWRSRPTLVEGSPPRVRGTAPLPFRRGLRAGITPACAGNSHLKFLLFFRNKDHPRVCGEQVFLLSSFGFYKGSPPRVRGTGKPAARNLWAARITPACAGNRCVDLRRKPRQRDHPRVCGEQFGDGAPVLGEAGSPPRVRGTGLSSPCLAPASRITPACAGNSRCRVLVSVAAQDHPRVCGEQRSWTGCSGPGRGSPPRVRGTDGRADGGLVGTGITPACAGNSIHLRLSSL